MFELVKGTQAASLYIAKEADDFAGLSHVAEKSRKILNLSRVWRRKFVMRCRRDIR